MEKIKNNPGTIQLPVDIPIIDEQGQYLMDMYPDVEKVGGNPVLTMDELRGGICGKPF